MAFIEHLHGTGAASSSEKVRLARKQCKERFANSSRKISALQRQLEDLRSENERLVSENKSLEEVRLARKNAWNA